MADIGGAVGVIGKIKALAQRNSDKLLQLKAMLIQPWINTVGLERATSSVAAMLQRPNSRSSRG